MDADGTVYVRTDDGERAVGSYPAGTPAEALAYFARKYAELLAQVDLAERRLSVPDAPVADIGRAVSRLRSSLGQAQVVGDLDALARRLDALASQVGHRRQQADAEQQAARQRARAQRSALVEEAEAIAATDPAHQPWKASGDRLRELFGQWQDLQRSPPRLDRASEDELWKRFGRARTTFDRLRRQHFTQLDEGHDQARVVKERIVLEAESLATSTDWKGTSAAYRSLMDRWKAAGRATRKNDDALWARLRAAQDRFFGARAAQQEAQEEELRANLAVKEAVLAEAEALLPVTDVARAKVALRDLQDRWDAAGKVPRADLGRVEHRMRAVEEAVRGADQARTRRANPETRARAEGALGQLEESIAALEATLDAAQRAGDAAAAADAEASLAVRRSWLEQVRRAAADDAG